MNERESSRPHVPLTKAAFRLLLGLSLVLPVVFVAGIFGASVPDSLVTVVVVLAGVSAVAIGVLTIWALRLIDRDSHLSTEDKSAWRRFVFFSGIIGASVYLVGYLRRNAAAGT